ncbi:MAG: hypothetical protein JWM27_265 [Gemmatimonadetes bacterium]|nr:hypothetical protein [Gemmatimonadota bacterium]
MRRALLLATLLLAAAAGRAGAQAASGYLGVSATVLPAPATASVGSELSVRQTAQGVTISAPVRMGGAGPAIVSVGGVGGAGACRMPSLSSASSEGTAHGRSAGRVSCSVTLADARRAGGADVPVSILIVPAT